MSEEKSVPEMVMEQEKQGNVVFEGIEGTMGAKISEFIQQPVEGILYDLNRDKVTLFSQYSKDNIRWINDYAVAVTITALRAELERVKAENEWHKYIDGDTSTYPNNDGLIFQIIYGVDGNEWEGHAFYGFVHGWSTDKNVLWYRSVPNTPAAPEEGE